MMGKIKKPYIIFDFGNILIDINYQYTLEAFNKLLGFQWRPDTIPEEVKGWMKTYESGKLTSENFIWNFQSKFDASLNPRDIIKAWNAILIGIPKGRIEWIKNLRSSYKVALLSNTNELHLEWVDKHLKAEHNTDIESFNTQCFDHTFYSHIVKARKPDQEIYDLVETALEHKGSDILFIDDLAKNVIAARIADWIAVQHRPETKIEDELNTYLEFWNLMSTEESDQ